MDSVFTDFHSEVSNGISLFTALKNRSSLFEKALASWVLIDDIDEIIVVDWSSDESIKPIIDIYQNGKIKLIHVLDQKGWSQPIAFNLASRFTSKDKILKIDADIELGKDFFVYNILLPNHFMTGNYLTARNENESHLNGTIFLYRDDFFKVNCYNESLVVYGYDDSDLYNRLEEIGLIKDDFNFDTLHHIEHGGRTTFQFPSEILENLNDCEWSSHSILINRYLSNYCRKWSKSDKMVNFSIDRVDFNFFQCVLNDDFNSIYSQNDRYDAEIFAIKYRIKELGVNCYDREIFVTEDFESIELYNLFLYESKVDKKIIFPLIVRVYNFIFDNFHKIKEYENEIVSLNSLNFEQRSIIESLTDDNHKIRTSIYYKDELLKNKNRIILEKEFQINQLKEKILEFEKEKSILSFELDNSNVLIKRSLEDIIRLNQFIELKNQLLSGKQYEIEELEHRVNALQNEIKDKSSLIESISNQNIALRDSKTFKIIRLISKSIDFFKLFFQIAKIKSIIRLNRRSRFINKSKFFDLNYYLENNPDVALAGIDPAKHYLLYGGFEGRNPSVKFSSGQYLCNNPDVKRAGMNPLLHYELWGKQEKRMIFPA